MSSAHAGPSGPTPSANDGAFDPKVAYPSELELREMARLWIRRRRVRSDLDGAITELLAGRLDDAGKAKLHAGLKAEVDPTQARGIAISGGGIRSATFALGVFQGLARLGLLKHADFVSTVSGGGYFGAFLGRLFTRSDVGSAKDVEDMLCERVHPEVVRKLRENGRYLAPQGSGDLLLDMTVLLRNWVALLVVILTGALLAFLTADCLKRAAHLFMPRVYEWVERLLNQHLPFGGDTLWWSVWLIPPLWLGVLGALPLGVAYWLDKRSMVWVTLLGVLVAVGVERGLVFPETTLLAIASVSATLLAPLAFFVARATAERALEAAPSRASLPDGAAKEPLELSIELRMRHELSRWLTKAMVLFALLLLFALIDTFGQTLYLAIASKRLEAWIEWLVGVGAVLGAAAASGKRILMTFFGGVDGKRMSLPGSLVAGLLAAIVVLALGIAIGTAANALAYRGEAPPHAQHWLALDEEARVVLFQGSEEPELGNLEVALVKPAAPKPGGEGRDPVQVSMKNMIPDDLEPALIAWLLAALASMVFGSSFRFVTRSSHHPLYRARLTRAYLGASNPNRLTRNVTEVVEGDDIRPVDYYRLDAKAPATSPYAREAPLHLINVTVNETVDRQTGVQQQDRKGTGLAVGPCGFSLGVRHHAVFDWTPPEGGHGDRIEPTQVTAFPALPTGRSPAQKAAGPFDAIESKHAYSPEGLTIGKWVAISGAAFSTGLGARTSLGMSLLAGLANVRLGYWWHPGIQKSPFHFLRTQRYLLNELSARFPGTSDPHWYLSDGGHFENMAAYELIRRRVRSMLVIDAEADPGYTFEGLANLVRKARLDFGAEITFMDERELDTTLHSSVRPLFGTLEQLRRGKWGKLPRNVPAGTEREVLEEPLEQGLSLAHAALARVTYRDDAGHPDGRHRGYLLYVKPTLTGNEPIDLVEYHASHAPFPQETTADQFFDEAQWESYRKLGDHIARLLFTVDGLKPDGTSVGPQWIARDLLVSRAP